MDTLRDIWTSESDYEYISKTLKSASLVKTTTSNSQLYLSSEQGALDLINRLVRQTSKRPIYVLTINDELLAIPTEAKHLVKAHIFHKLEDEPHANLYLIINRAINFIHASLQVADAIVIVHCYAGISRSASIILAYLMKSENTTLDKSYALLKSKRTIIDPNDGFIKQLQEWWLAHDMEEPFDLENPLAF